MSVSLELSSALIDVQNVCHEYGTILTINQRGEAQIARDSYQSIEEYKASSAPLTIYAWPVTYDPSERELDRVGIFERYQCLAYTPMKDWTDANMTFQSIDALRWTVVLEGVEWKIGKKQLSDKFAGGNLYIVLAMMKKGA